MHHAAEVSVDDTADLARAALRCFSELPVEGEREVRRFAERLDSPESPVRMACALKDLCTVPDTAENLRKLRPTHPTQG